jgi:hypothetical protein
MRTIFRVGGRRTLPQKARLTLLRMRIPFILTKEGCFLKDADFDFTLGILSFGKTVSAQPHP